jgi:hypothetical protein
VHHWNRNGNRFPKMVVPPDQGFATSLVAALTSLAPTSHAASLGSLDTAACQSIPYHLCFDIGRGFLALDDWAIGSLV